MIVATNKQNKNLDPSFRIPTEATAINNVTHVNLIEYIGAVMEEQKRKLILLTFTSFPK